MSKVGITLGVLVIGSGASLTGAYALGAFDPDYELPRELKTDDLEKQKQVFDEGCVRSLFGRPKDVDSTTAADVDSGTKVDTSFFTTGEGTNTQGCLVVNGDKKFSTESSKTNKWKGDIRFLGVVKEEAATNSKGFVVFILGTAENGTSNQISGKGTSYKMIQETVGEWKISGKLGVKTGITHFGNSTEDAKFPRPGDSLGDDLKNRKFWGFFENASDLSNVCGTDCTNFAPETKFRGYGTWDTKTDKQQNLSGWTQEIDKGGTEIFDVDNGNMKSAVEGKQGKGIKRIIYSSVKIK